MKDANYLSAGSLNAGVDCWVDSCGWFNDQVPFKSLAGNNIPCAVIGLTIDYQVFNGNLLLSHGAKAVKSTNAPNNIA